MICEPSLVLNSRTVDVRGLVCDISSSTPKVEGKEPSCVSPYAGRFFIESMKSVVDCGLKVPMFG